MKKWLAVLLALVFIGASAECLADCAGQVSKIPPCHQHSQHKCSTESQLVASSPDSHLLPATFLEPDGWMVQTAVVAQFRSDDSRLDRTASETPPPLANLRI